MSSQNNWNNPDMYYQQPQSGPTTGSGYNNANANYGAVSYNPNAAYGANTQYAGPVPVGGYQPLPPTNSLAIIALVSSIFGVLSGVFLGGIAGVIMGHIARKQIRASGERGEGMNTAALWVGYIGTGLWLVFWVVMVLFYLGMFALMFAAS